MRGDLSGARLGTSILTEFRLTDILPPCKMWDINEYVATPQTPARINRLRSWPRAQATRGSPCHSNARVTAVNARAAHAQVSPHEGARAIKPYRHTHAETEQPNATLSLQHDYTLTTRALYYPLHTTVSVECSIRGIEGGVHVSRIRTYTYDHSTR